MQSALSQQSSLSNLQLELLKLYSFNLKTEELLEVKRMLGQHFAARLSAQASLQYEQQGWSQETLDSWLNNAACS